MNVHNPFLGVEEVIAINDHDSTLRRYRIDRKIPLSTLARVSRISESYVYRIELRQCNLTKNMADRLIIGYAALGHDARKVVMDVFEKDLKTPALTYRSGLGRGRWKKSENRNERYHYTWD